MSDQTNNAVGIINISTELTNLSKEIASVPEPWASNLRLKFDSLSNEILRCLAATIERDKSILVLVEQAKLDTQYLDFDLEATKREKRELQSKIDDILGTDGNALGTDNDS